MSCHRRSTLSLPLVAVLLVPTLAATGPLGEAVHIAGRVVQEDTGAPLEAAQVGLRDLPYGALTDRHGRYAFDVPRSRLLEGEVHLQAMLIGYASADSTIQVSSDFTGDSLTVDFRLRPQVISLDEVTISGTTYGTPAPATAKTGAAGRAVRPSTPPPPPSASTTSPAAPHPGPTRSAEALRVRPGTPVRASAGDGRWFHPRGYPGLGPNREEYAPIEENAFRSVKDHPLSTFSIDVDRASYSNIRRFLLRDRQLPPVDAVQIEEMVNYFSYRYNRPTGDDPLAVTTEVGEAPWAPAHRLLRVGLASRPIEPAEQPPANLVFLLDVSGSMSAPDKLPLVKASMRLLVDHLRRQDRVAVVVYSGAAGVVLEPTSGAHRERILEAIDELHAGGSTAGGAGLRLAYDVARRSFRRGGNNRVILATDGDFNVGESSDAAMVRLIEEKRAQGTFLTVLGFGTGNLQSEKMQQLAQHGNGNYAYIDGLPEARKVLVNEMGGTLVTVAKDVKVQIEFNPERVRAYRLLGYENRLLAAEDFNNDRKDAGDLGAGHTVTALYEIVPAGVDEHTLPPEVDPLRYRALVPPALGSRSGELAFVKVRYKHPHGTESRLLQRPVRDTGETVSSDFTFAAAVAGFGMLLRNSEYGDCISPEQVVALAEDGLGDDPDGYRHEFLRLVQAYRSLTWRRDGAR